MGVESTYLDGWLMRTDSDCSVSCLVGRLMVLMDRLGALIARVNGLWKMGVSILVDSQRWDLIVTCMVYSQSS